MMWKHILTVILADRAASFMCCCITSYFDSRTWGKLHTSCQWKTRGCCYYKNVTLVEPYFIVRLLTKENECNVKAQMLLEKSIQIIV